MSLKKVSLVILALFILGGSVRCGGTKTEYTDNFFGAFDTIINIRIYAKNQSEFNEFRDLTKAKLLEYSRLYDGFKDFEGINNLKTINDNAGIEPVKVDKRIIDMLQYSIDTNKKYKGHVNIAFGSVLEVWYKYRQNSIDNGISELPTLEELQSANKHTSIENVVIDKEKSTVFLKDKDMALDVGAVAKGYAVEKTAEDLKAKGYTDFLINAGGNVKAVGKPARVDGKWGIGIQDPDTANDAKENQLLEVVYANDISVVTSGIYQRFYTVDGVNYNHIIDPKSLYPANNYKSVSIICKDSALCDFLSTNTFLMKPEEAMKLIESIKDAEAIFVLSDGKILYSSGVKQYLEE